MYYISYIHMIYGNSSCHIKSNGAKYPLRRTSRPRVTMLDVGNVHIFGSSWRVSKVIYLWISTYCMYIYIYTYTYSTLLKHYCSIIALYIFMIFHQVTMIDFRIPYHVFFLCVRMWCSRVNKKHCFAPHEKMS